MDRYTKFANAWKTVGVSSKVRWQQRSVDERLSTGLARKLIERFGNEAKAALAEVALQIGLEDGRKICENLRIDPESPRASLIPLETVSLLSGVDYEVTGDNKARQFPHLTIKSGGCILGKVFEGIDPDIREHICESYTMGLVQAVTKDAQVKVLRKCCAGNSQCELVVSFK
ncbi:hypothetical protein [Methanocella sp. MCL-LM]|uniref:hypothetical protein n=1 Tax=Methanocella sp. MCL-LM TaxID=3412035 RepID=UPI003C73544F